MLTITEKNDNLTILASYRSRKSTFSLFSGRLSICADVPVNTTNNTSLGTFTSGGRGSCRQMK